jgi:hypothetical protein
LLSPIFRNSLYILNLIHCWLTLPAEKNGRYRKKFASLAQIFETIASLILFDEPSTGFLRGFLDQEQRNVKRMMHEMDCFATALPDQLQFFETITSLNRSPFHRPYSQT